MLINQNRSPIEIERYSRADGTTTSPVMISFQDFPKALTAPMNNDDWIMRTPPLLDLFIYKYVPRMRLSTGLVHYGKGNTVSVL